MHAYSSRQDLLKPDVKPDDPAPHLFAQGLGALMLIASVVALWAGAAALGWLLAGVVVALAAVNLFLNFCLGCFLYYQLARPRHAPRICRPGEPRNRRPMRRETLK